MGASGCATPYCPLAKRHHDVFFVETSCVDNGITGVAASQKLRKCLELILSDSMQFPVSLVAGCRLLRQPTSSMMSKPS